MTDRQDREEDEQNMSGVESILDEIERTKRGDQIGRDKIQSKLLDISTCPNGQTHNLDCIKTCPSFCIPSLWIEF